MDFYDIVDQIIPPMLGKRRVPHAHGGRRGIAETDNALIRIPHALGLRTAPPRPAGAPIATLRPSDVEGQLPGCLQAVGTEPHDFLACLPAAPAAMLGIDQAAACLPAMGTPALRHLVFAVQSTQRNTEPRILTMSD